MQKYDLLLHIWPDFSHIRTCKLNGKTRWIGCDAVWAIGRVNTTNAIRGSLKYPKVNDSEIMMLKVSQVNHRRKVYTLSLEGIYQLIECNKSDICIELKKKIKQAGI